MTMYSKNTLAKKAVDIHETIQRFSAVFAKMGLSDENANLYFACEAGENAARKLSEHFDDVWIYLDEDFEGANCIGNGFFDVEQAINDVRAYLSSAQDADAYSKILATLKEIAATLSDIRSDMPSVTDTQAWKDDMLEYLANEREEAALWFGRVL